MRKRWKAWASVASIVSVLAAGGGQVYAKEQSEQPLRVSQEAVPAKIAFTRQDHLWLLDARIPGAKPKQVEKDGFDQIVGWSKDGEWLLFLKYKGSDTYSAPGYLWAVKADGSGAFQIDDRPVMDQPKWSPVDKKIAYFVQTGSAEDPKPFFVIKEIKDNQAVEVHATKEVDFVDFSWMPDGERLLVSTSAAKDRAMNLVLRELTGKTVATYPIAAPPNVEEGIYAWAARAMAISSDGAHVGYYLQYNSASLSADGVPIELFDLSQPNKKPVELGTGLIHPQWLRWSPDGRQLAFIDGTDRMATYNKHLNLADPSGKVVSDSPKDSVDTMPTWTTAAPYSLFFTRGKGTEYHYDPQKVMVPGQRIWQKEAGAPAKQVTQGTMLTADYFPYPSPDGKQLFFVRVDQAQKGSLYLSVQGKETELLRDVTGDIGYYANYLPQWISVYWESKTTAASLSK
ncbi:hypothetical protein [Brevibacillus choshinensis]|uniref:hypothetical protein n=1 Tax=Brevibacillus choshinensis TaxID=54911 RepID=UPI002E213A47|nr:hypothetical protein [Brevibacillus choshinensis]